MLHCWCPPLAHCFEAVGTIAIAPHRRQVHATCMALEQRRADQGLQISKQPCQGWLRDADRQGLMFLPQARAWAENLDVAGYRGWRLPTINELVRPFRVGPDATAANTRRATASSAPTKL